MRLPHVFIAAGWERRITGHQGFTYLCFTFVDLTHEQVMLPVHAGFRQHEQRHVQQSVAVTLLWIALVAFTAIAFHLSPLWLLTSLAAWPLVYFAVSVVWKVRTGKGYTDNFFERDARRYARRQP